MRRAKDTSTQCNVIWIGIFFMQHREIQGERDKGNVLTKLPLATAAFLRLCCEVVYGACYFLFLIAFCGLRVAVYPNELLHLANE